MKKCVLFFASVGLAVLLTPSLAAGHAVLLAAGDTAQQPPASKVPASTAPVAVTVADQVPAPTLQPETAKKVTAYAPA